GVSGGDPGEADGVGAERLGVADEDGAAFAAAEPQRLGLLLVEGHGGARAGDLEVEPVLASGGDLADDGGADHAALGGELEGDDVLGGDLASAAGRVGLGQLGRDGADAVAGDELEQVAPVGADVAEGAQRPALVGVDAPVVVLGPQQPVLEV